MDSTGLGLLIAGVIVAILLALIFWWYCIKKKGKEVLIKRCKRQNTSQLEDRIIKRLDSRGVVERVWSQDLDDGEQPVIVFCAISSRIGTDIENAMIGVHGNSPVILVLLHSVLSNLLGNRDLSDDEALLDPTMLERMSGIAHFAFSVGEGLYKCRQNEIGHQKLVSHVMKLFCDSRTTIK